MTALSMLSVSGNWKITGGTFLGVPRPSSQILII